MKFIIDGIEINDLCIEELRYTLEHGTRFKEIDAYLLNDKMRNRILIKPPIWGNICRIDKDDQLEYQKLLKNSDKVIMYNVMGEFTDKAKETVTNWFHNNLSETQIETTDFDPVTSYTPFHMRSQS